jgi:hypothetical protein
VPSTRNKLNTLFFMTQKFAFLLEAAEKLHNQILDRTQEALEIQLSDLKKLAICISIIEKVNKKRKALSR